MRSLTHRQGEILQYIIYFIEENGYAPTYREIGAKFDIDSTNGVSDHLKALKRKGYLLNFGGGARALTVLRDPWGRRIRYQLLREPIMPEDLR